MYSSDNNKVFNSCISLVTLRNSYVMMHGPMNIKRTHFTIYIRSIALYDAETWTLREVDLKYVGRFAMLCWRMMKIGCTDL